MSTVPAEVHGPSDAELIESVRNGTVSAYGSLYERHVGAAYNLARQLSRSQAESDDLVSEAFAKVLDTLRAGRGPDSAFRAYLLTALRHTAYDKTRRDRKVELSDDVTAIAGADTAVPFSDTAVAGLERSLAARAFARLPERWQAVLWHTEVEGQTPAEVAPILGLTPNGVSALAYRAREGLRQAYLQVHLAESDNERCRATAERLGAWTRSGLSKRETAQVESHLDECERCRALAAELADVNGGLRGIIAPLVLGVGALGYLAAAGAKAGSAAVAGAAAGAAAGAGGAAGAASSLPRQFIGVAASATALAAAIAIALTSGTPAELPIAQSAPPPPTSQTTNPPPNNPPGPPPVPPPPQNTPTQPSQTPAPTPTPTTPVPLPIPGQPIPQPTSQAPQPDPPNLTAPSPQPITLVPGTGPSELPITVQNTGGSVSEPVIAALNLPPGVSAVGPARFSSGPLLRLNAAQPPTAVQCPGGSGTVTCTNGRGLQPGEEVTLQFQLEASEDSLGGNITGFITAGSSLSVAVSVKVDVKPLKDGVALLAAKDWFDFTIPGRRHRAGISAVATNTGESTKQVTVSFDQPVRLESSFPRATCTTNGATTNCVTATPLKPGDQFLLAVRLVKANGGEDPGGETRKQQWQKFIVGVTATLGNASAYRTVEFKYWSWPPQDPKPTSTKPTPTTKPTEPSQTTKPTEPTSPTVTTTTPEEPTTTTEPTKPPPSEETKPSTTPTRTTEPQPDDCDTVSDVERLLAVLTGRCPAPEGPAPR